LATIGANLAIIGAQAVPMKGYADLGKSKKVIFKRCEIQRSTIY